MDVLTPSQYQILKFAWQQNSFTIEELARSDVGADRKDATLRTVCDRIVDKGFLSAEKKKGQAVRYAPIISKQNYMILLAQTWFADASEDDKRFFKWAMDQI